MKRRDFIKSSAAGAALYLGAAPLRAENQPVNGLISPGCRRSKVKVARLYMGNPAGLWPKPKLDFQAEIAGYRAAFEKMAREIEDVEFVTDALITSPEQLEAHAGAIQSADGVLLIHLSLGIRSILERIIEFDRPTVVFAVPYSGHEWVQFGALQRSTRMVSFLSSDLTRLAEALAPIRALHHLREAVVLNLTSNFPEEYAAALESRFGVRIKPISLQRIMDAVREVSDRSARAEAKRWMDEAVRVIEPDADEIFRSCKLALAFERVLQQEDATVMTVDCYGSMYGPLCVDYAFPCIGFARLNNMGLGGICESDLRSAVTHILFQGLCGRPGFISDPTVDESNNTIILAHCLGTPKMDGPSGPAAPYSLRSIMERQQGAVTEVDMRIGQKVTQAILVDDDRILYFTGDIVAVPKTDRGCRTKIAVSVDGGVRALWQNWSGGLHRVTCYGDLSLALKRFGRLAGVEVVDETERSLDEAI